MKINSLDIEDDLEWGIQFGTAAYDEPSAILASGTSVFVVGTIRDDSNVLSELVLCHLESVCVCVLCGW